MTSEGHPYARFRRAIDNRNLLAAEDAIRELTIVSLDDALQLVHLYAERSSPKFELAARRWLVRYITEARPSLTDVVMTAANLHQHAQRGDAA